MIYNRNISYFWQLCWLCLLEYKHYNNNKHEYENFSKKIEFEILIHETLSLLMNKENSSFLILIEKLLRHMFYQNHHKIVVNYENDLFENNEDENFLKIDESTIKKHFQQLFIQLPCLLGYFIRYYITNSLNINIFQDISIEILNFFISKGDYDKVFEYIQFLNIDQKKNINIYSQICNLFIRLLQQSQIIQNQNEQNFILFRNNNLNESIIKHKIYSSLISHSLQNNSHQKENNLKINEPKILKHFSILEDEFIKQKMESKLEIFLNLPENIFWNSFYNFIRINKIHFIEYILEQCIYNIQIFENDLMNSFLQKFLQLQPLICILAWDINKSYIIRHYKKLSNTIWNLKEKSLSSSFFNICSQISYIMEITWWYYENDEKNITLDEIFHNLSNHSILYTLQSKLYKIDIQQLIDIIKKNPNKSKKVNFILILVFKDILGFKLSSYGLNFIKFLFNYEKFFKFI